MSRATSNIICVLDADGRYLKIGSAAREGLYRPADELLGRRVDEVLPPATAAIFLATISAALGTGEPQRLEYQLTIAGEVVCFVATASPTVDRTVVWMARDVTTERRAEAAGREQESNFRALLEHAFDGILLCDDTLHCVDANERFCAMVGRTVADVLGRSYVDFLLPDDLVTRPLRLAELYEERRLATERRLARPDGTIIDAEVGATLLDDGRILFVVRDLAARHAAEAALRDSETRFRSAFHFSGIGLTLTSPAGRFLQVNPALCRILGYTECDLLERSFQQITHADDLDADLAYVQRVLAGELDSYDVEKRYRHRDGHVVWALLTVSLVRDAAGAPLYFISQVQDISERRTAEAAQARLTAILESMPDMVAIGTPDGRLAYLNAAARRILGVGAAAPGQPPPPMPLVADVQPQFAPGGALSAAMREAVRAGVWRGETTFRKRDGRELPVEQTLIVHRASDGSVEYVSAILRDITERKQTEATLRALALVDDLTGLYNRRGFLALAEQEWERARCDGRSALLLYVDLDDFKTVNDTWGHAEGDDGLRAIADVLRVTFRERDVLSRMGGDEFTVFAVAGAGGGCDELTRVIRARLSAALAACNRRRAKPYTLALSTGVAASNPASPATLATLMIEADAQLYERKRARRSAAGCPA